MVEITLFLNLHKGKNKLFCVNCSNCISLLFDYEHFFVPMATVNEVTNFSRGHLRYIAFVS